MKFNSARVLILLIFITAFGLEWQALYSTARRNPSMIIDSLNQRVILFGGTSCRLNNRYFNDVWEISLNNPNGYFWLPVSVSGTSPSGRAGPAAVYDQKYQRMLIFGGDNGGGVYLNDVWALNLTLGNERWERLVPTGTPPPGRTIPYSIYHPTRHSLILFGGDIGGGQAGEDLWKLKLDSLVWRKLLVSPPKPARRSAGGAMFDRTNNRMIIFGGAGDYWYNEVWALDLTPGSEHWTQLNPTGSIRVPGQILLMVMTQRGTNFISLPVLIPTKCLMMFMSSIYQL